MNFVDLKYIDLCCSQLKNFHKKGQYCWNFSCPICLDSHKSNRKARGYIYENKGKLLFYCHNCGLSLSISNFLKQVNPALYKTYSLEHFSNNKHDITETVNDEKFIPKFIDFSLFSNLKKISELPDKNPFKEFIDKRKIPKNYYSRLFACPNFMKWTNKIKPNSFSIESLKYDESRLIIPFLNKEKNVIAFQGRTIQSSQSPKYLTIILDNNNHAIFGLDKVDRHKQIYVTEGAINSFFISNSLAVSGNNLLSISNYFPKNNVILIFDNEPRNEQVVKKMNHAINDYYKIVIWPSSFKWKDINEAIMDGNSEERIIEIINKNIFHGLYGKLRINEWRK